MEPISDVNYAVTVRDIKAMWIIVAFVSSFTNAQDLTVSW